MNRQSVSRSLPIDVLRGCAILLVLFRHPIVHAPSAGILSPLAGALETFGWSGVDLFFVLSGFLIGSLLFVEIKTQSRIDIRRFLIRRAFKIWPGYVALLAVAFVQEIRHLKRSPLAALHDLLPSLAHLQNYFWSVRGQTWSLAIEEHFYLLLPLLLLLLIKRKGGAIRDVSHIPLMALFFGILCLGLRCWAVCAIKPWDAYKHVTPTHLRVDSLFFGVLLGYLHVYQPQRLAVMFRRRRLALTIGISLLAPLFFFQIGSALVTTLGFTAAYLGYGCILMVFVHSPPNSGMLANIIYGPIGRCLAFIGLFSYSIYLWHLDLAEPILVERLKYLIADTARGGFRWTLSTLLYIPLAVATGIIMAKLIEQPMLALRNRLFPARSKVFGGEPSMPSVTPTSVAL